MYQSNGAPEGAALIEKNGQCAWFSRLGLRLAD